MGVALFVHGVERKWSEDKGNNQTKYAGVGDLFIMVGETCQVLVLIVNMQVTHVTWAS